LEQERTRDLQEVSSVSINKSDLSIEQVLAVSRYFARVERFTGDKRKQMESVRRYVEENWLSDEAAPQYGFNTGIGALKSIKISEKKIKDFQRFYVRSHCVGVGDPLPIEVVRGAMLLQANALSKGYSGIRPLIIDKLIEMLNKRIHPVVPEQGSLGASGDLAPLAHIASVLVGEPEAEIWVDGQRQPLLKLQTNFRTFSFELDGEKVSFDPVELHGKEAISLTNSTAVMLSIGMHLIRDVELLLKNADIAAALSLEAMMCEQKAFDEDLHRIRNQDGQIRTAANIRELVRDTERMTPKAQLRFFESLTKSQIENKRGEKVDPEGVQAIKNFKLDAEFQRNRVQDAYSLRCIPQVHGACKDTFHYVRSIFDRELHAVTDNPVIFPEGDRYKVRSGGNFHGEPLALALDFLAIAVSEIGSICERRMFRLLSPRMSFGLPANLTGGEVGLNSGFMVVQYTGAQLVSENKSLAHPASVDSVPTSDNQEDHVSMGMIAARKAYKILQNVQQLLAMEYLCAVQAIHLSSQLVDLQNYPLGIGTRLAFEFLTRNEEYPLRMMANDEYMHTKLITLERMSSHAQVIQAVERQIKLLT